MLNIELPTAEDLQPLIDEALSEKEDYQFIEDYLKGLAINLEKNPQNYLLFGAYWWAIRALLQEHGLMEFVEDPDYVMEKVFNYDDPVLLICAAYAYQSYRLENGFFQQSKHQYEHDDGVLEYMLEDFDMELRISNTKQRH